MMIKAFEETEKQDGNGGPAAATDGTSA